MKVWRQRTAKGPALRCCCLLLRLCLVARQQQRCMSHPNHPAPHPTTRSSAMQCNATLRSGSEQQGKAFLFGFVIHLTSIRILPACICLVCLASAHLFSLSSLLSLTACLSFPISDACAALLLLCALFFSLPWGCVLACLCRCCCCCCCVLVANGCFCLCRCWLVVLVLGCSRCW